MHRDKHLQLILVIEVGNYACVVLINLSHWDVVTVAVFGLTIFVIFDDALLKLIQSLNQVIVLVFVEGQLIFK